MLIAVIEIKTASFHLHGRFERQNSLDNPSQTRSDLAIILPVIQKVYLIYLYYRYLCKKDTRRKSLYRSNGFFESIRKRIQTHREAFVTGCVKRSIHRQFEHTMTT